MRTELDQENSSLLFLVAWNRPDLWDYLRRWFAEVENVEVNRATGFAITYRHG